MDIFEKYVYPPLVCSYDMEKKRWAYSITFLENVFVIQIPT